MNGEQFLGEVKNLAELDGDEGARRAIAATLETLKERLAGREPSDLAAQLPPEIAPYVEGDGGGESFPAEEFYERVAKKDGVGQGEATRHARAAATVLQTAVSGGELDDVRTQVGDPYEELFGQSGAPA